MTSMTLLAASNIVRNYDVRTYNAAEEGLQDLTFEVRYDGLKEMVSERLGIDGLVDLYFQVYWITPGRFEVRIAGLPDGFEELRAQLRAMIRPRLELIIPEALTARLRGYQLRSRSIDGGQQVIAEDPTHGKAINRILINFDRSGRMTRIQTQSPMGTNTTHLEMTPKSWSNNKWVIDRMEVRTVQGIQMTTQVKEITYTAVAGFGLPEKIKIKTTQQLVRPENEEGETFEQVEEGVVRFSNYVVNSGNAKKIIIQN